jgi:predicted phosphodiesterase
MRIAALYDIHANLPALEAVLNEIESAKIERIVVGGDVVPGPMPRETLMRLRSLSIPVDFLYGNGEIAVLAQMAGEEPVGVPQAHRQVIRWTSDSLGPLDREFLGAWPKTLQLHVNEIGSVLFCHATPRDENECFTLLTPEDHLRPIFEAVGAHVVVCGHTHMQFERRVAGVRVVNAGSVGMPFGDPGAYWLVIGPDIEFRCTPYDLQTAAARIRDTHYPEAEDFAVHNVLNPPSQSEMLKILTRE